VAHIDEGGARETIYVGRLVAGRERREKGGEEGNVRAIPHMTRSGLHVAVHAPFMLLLL